jgi:hypothetical protein
LKNRALEAIAVDGLEEVEVGVLLHAEARERAFRHVIVEVPLGVGVLEPEGVAAVQRAADAGLPRDVRGDPEQEHVARCCPVTLM